MYGNGPFGCCCGKQLTFISFDMKIGETFLTQPHGSHFLTLSTLITHRPWRCGMSEQLICLSRHENTWTKLVTLWPEIGPS